MSEEKKQLNPVLSAMTYVFDFTYSLLLHYSKIVLLLIVIIRCVMVGIRSGSNMGSLVCFGVAAFLTFQTFENIGMCIGITPVIGITLPFFSYGGSSLFTTFAALGMVSGIHFRPRPKRNSIYY